MRESRSSYAPVARSKKGNVNGRPPRETSDQVGRTITQEERVELAERAFYKIRARAAAEQWRDPILNAAVEGRRLDMERARHALAVLTSRRTPQEAP
jgi:hypothetical protein